jgi:PKHD-type hydroxylase
MWATSLIEDFFMRHQILNFGKSIEKLLKEFPDAPQEVLVPFEQVRTNFIREYGNL